MLLGISGCNNASTKFKGQELNITNYRDTTTKTYLEEAKKDFEEKYEGTKINIIDVDFTTINQDNYVKKVKEELADGTGTDMYASYLLPWYAYAENGNIEDLEKYMNDDKEFKKEDYYYNIIDGIKYNEKNYVMPTEFSFKFVAYNGDLIDGEILKSKKSFTYEDVVELSKDVVDKDNNKIKSINLSERALFNQIFYENYNQYVDLKNKSYDEEKIKQLMDKVMEYKNKGYVFEFPEDMSKHSEMLESFEYPFTETSSVINMILEEQDFVATSNKKYLGLFKNNNGKNMFALATGFFINADSKNKDLAWEFTKFLVSEEMQSSSSLQYHRVNNKVYKKILKTTGASDEKANYYVEIVNGLESATIVDSVNFFDITTIVKENFLTGEKSSQETMNIIKEEARFDY